MSPVGVTVPVTVLPVCILFLAVLTVSVTCYTVHSVWWLPVVKLFSEVYDGVLSLGLGGACDGAVCRAGGQQAAQVLELCGHLTAQGLETLLHVLGSQVTGQVVHVVWGATRDT